MNYTFTLLLISFLHYYINFNTQNFIEIETFDIAEARQGVAVDSNYFYAIDSRAIGKYNKRNGKFIKSWKDNADGLIKHLDSGVIFEDKLYCAHSNYPEFPMTSSVEIWDSESLEHIDSYSFGIEWGSCTWVDRYNGFWWGSFSHYNKWKDSTNTDVRWTQLVKFDNNWNKLESWVFPKKVLANFGNMSNSGGSWGNDGFLYCTGHDNAEVYKMELPKKGSELIYISSINLTCSGQGISWDRFEKNIIYSIHKTSKKVIKSKLIVK